MIAINDEIINVKHFPDSTQLLKYDKVGWENYYIIWHYENDEELLTLIYLVNHIRQGNPKSTIKLYMPYIPNARMDRTKNTEEVFTLKYFTKVINGLKFDEVTVLDPHSDVSVALLDNVKVISANLHIEQALKRICSKYQFTKDDLIVYFPDAGAYKRYKDIPCLEPFEKIYGKKVRDWSTGKILGLDIVDKDERPLEIFEEIDYSNPDTFDPDRFVKVKPLKDKYVLMIDDIISYGGTMYYSAKKLDELGAKEIFAYATHVESKSLWDVEKGTFRKALGFTNEDGSENKQIVEKLFTTDSIYNSKLNSNLIEIV